MEKSTVSKVKHNYNELTKLLTELTHLNNINGLLEWDQNVMLPSGSTDSRSKQLEALAGVLHEKRTSKELETLINSLVNEDLKELNEYDRAVVRDAKRNFDRTIKIPKSLAQEEARLQGQGLEIWVNARKENNFSKFAPIIKRWIELLKEKSHYIDPKADPYDVCIDNFERGTTSTRIKEIFEEIKQPLVKLIADIKNQTNTG